MYSPRSSNQLWVYCIDSLGQIVWDCNVTYWTGYYIYTNAHLHDSPRAPESTVSPGGWTCSGCQITLETTKIGLAEKLMHRPNTEFGTTGTYNYAVGFTDIYWVEEKTIAPNNGRWVHVGGGTTGHGGNEYNHWMEQGAAYGIYYTINDFATAYPEQTRVCVNDMALPFGGKFDIYRSWDSPHQWHDRGLAVDIATTGGNACPTQGSGGIPTGLADVFVRQCLNQGADPARTHSVSNHIHCNWYDDFTPAGG